MSKIKDIEYGDVEIESPKDWDKKEVKIRITTFLDQDLLLEIKKNAKLQKKKYQSYINERLREVFFEEESVESRLMKLENKVFKRKA